MRLFWPCGRCERVGAVGAAMLLASVGGNAAMAQTMVPLNGQTSEQVAADQQQCAQQATTQTGYNPATPPATLASKPVAGQRLAGAARGAVTGRVISNTTKETETATAQESGAKIGAMVGGSRQRQARHEQRSQTQQLQATQQDQSAAYSNAVTHIVFAGSWLRAPVSRHGA
jgi:hypothetical protein